MITEVLPCYTPFLVALLHRSNLCHFTTPHRGRFDLCHFLNKSREQKELSLIATGRNKKLSKSTFSKNLNMVSLFKNMKVRFLHLHAF